MLALKKKREAEAKAKAESEAAAALSGEGAVQSPGCAPSSASGGAAAESSSNKVSLLGIGGKKKKADGAGVGGNGQKKRSPGEIRIQKGEFGYVYDHRVSSGEEGCVGDSIAYLFRPSIGFRGFLPLGARDGEIEYTPHILSVTLIHDTMR
jgi:hypothetical protein